jgi:hypothetical protein
MQKKKRKLQNIFSAFMEVDADVDAWRAEQAGQLRRAMTRSNYLNPRQRRLALVAYGRRAHVAVLSGAGVAVAATAAGIAAAVLDGVPWPPVHVYLLGFGALALAHGSAAGAGLLLARGFEARPSNAKYLALFYGAVFEGLLALASGAWLMVGLALCANCGPARCGAAVMRTAVLALLLHAGLGVAAVAALVHRAWLLALRMTLTPLYLILFAAVYAPAERGASQDAIEELESHPFSPALRIDADHTLCGVCLCEYEEAEMLRFLPCGHHFHASCIDQWLTTNKSCPYCKRDIDSAGPRTGSMMDAAMAVAAAGDGDAGWANDDWLH